MSTLYIAQISDLHLYADTSKRMMGINTWDTFKSVMSLACGPAFPIDKIILSGDLCQDEKLETYHLLMDYLKMFPYPYHWIAGNHDSVKIMQTIAMNGQYNNEKIIDTDDWRIILANSNLPGNVRGNVTKKELSWVKKSCDNAKQKNIMLCIHHHMISVDSPSLDPLDINNSNELLKIIKACKKIRLVIFGHIHQDFEKKIGGVNYYATPSTCFQFAPKTDDFSIDQVPQGYRWIALHSDGSFTTQVRRCKDLPIGLVKKSHPY